MLGQCGRICKATCGRYAVVYANAWRGGEPKKSLSSKGTGALGLPIRRYEHQALRRRRQASCTARDPVLRRRRARPQHLPGQSRTSTQERGMRPTLPRLWATRHPTHQVPRSTVQPIRPSRTPQGGRRPCPNRASRTRPGHSDTLKPHSSTRKAMSGVSEPDKLGHHQETVPGHHCHAHAGW